MAAPPLAPTHAVGCVARFSASYKTFPLDKEPVLRTLRRRGSPRHRCET